MNKFLINNDDSLTPFWHAWVGDVLILGDRSHMTRVEPGLIALLSRRRLPSGRLPVITVGGHAMRKVESDSIWAEVGILSGVAEPNDPRVWFRPTLEYIHLASGECDALPSKDEDIDSLLSSLAAKQGALDVPTPCSHDEIGDFKDVRKADVRLEDAAVAWMIAGRCKQVAQWPCLNEVAMSWSEVEGATLCAVLAAAVPVEGWVDHADSTSPIHRMAMRDFDRAFGELNSEAWTITRKVLMAHAAGEIAITRDVSSSGDIWRTCHGTTPRAVIDVMSGRWVKLMPITPFKPQRLALASTLICHNSMWGKVLARANAPTAVCSSNFVWVRFPDANVGFANSWAQATGATRQYKMAATQLAQSVVRRSGNGLELVSGPVPTVAARDVCSGSWVCVGAASRHASRTDIASHQTSQQGADLELYYGRPMQWRREATPASLNHSGQSVRMGSHVWLVDPSKSTDVRGPTMWPLKAVAAGDSDELPNPHIPERVPDAGVSLRWLAEIHGVGVPVWFGSEPGTPPPAWAGRQPKIARAPSAAQAEPAPPAHAYTSSHRHEHEASDGQMASFMTRCQAALEQLSSNAETNSRERDDDEKDFTLTVQGVRENDTADHANGPRNVDERTEMAPDADTPASANPHESTSTKGQCDEPSASAPGATDVAPLHGSSTAGTPDCDPRSGEGEHSVVNETFHDVHETPSDESARVMVAEGIRARLTVLTSDAYEIANGVPGKSIPAAPNEAALNCMAGEWGVPVLLLLALQGLPCAFQLLALCSYALADDHSFHVPHLVQHKVASDKQIAERAVQLALACGLLTELDGGMYAPNPLILSLWEVDAPPD